MGKRKIFPTTGWNERVTVENTAKNLHAACITGEVNVETLYTAISFAERQCPKPVHIKITVYAGGHEYEDPRCPTCGAPLHTTNWYCAGSRLKDETEFGPDWFGCGQFLDWENAIVIERKKARSKKHRRQDDLQTT